MRHSVYCNQQLTYTTEPSISSRYVRVTACLTASLCDLLTCPPVRSAITLAYVSVVFVLVMCRVTHDRLRHRPASPRLQGNNRSFCRSSSSSSDARDVSWISLASSRVNKDMTSETICPQCPVVCLPIANRHTYVSAEGIFCARRYTHAGAV